MSTYIKSSGHYGERWDNALAVDGHTGKPVMGGDYVTTGGHNTRVLSPIAALQAWLENGGTLTAEHLDLTLHRPAGAGVPVPVKKNGSTITPATWQSEGKLITIYAPGGQQYTNAVTVILPNSGSFNIVMGGTAIKYNPDNGGTITTVIGGYQYYGYYVLYTPLPEKQEQEQ